MIRDRYTSHIFNQCIQPCNNNCGNQMTQEVMISHLQNDCPLQIMPCSAANVNCPWKGGRSEFALHINTCSYVSLSSVLASLQMRLVYAKTKAIKAEETITELKKVIHDLNAVVLSRIFHE